MQVKVTIIPPPGNKQQWRSINFLTESPHPHDAETIYKFVEEEAGPGHLYSMERNVAIVSNPKVQLPPGDYEYRCRTVKAKGATLKHPKSADLYFCHKFPVLCLAAWGLLRLLQPSVRHLPVCLAG